jgi:hypothetical protein
MKKKILWTVLLTGGLISSLAAFLFILTLILKSAVPVSMPFFSLSTDDQMWNKFGYVVAEGTWVMEKPDVMYSPFLANKIVCVKREGVCRDAEASVDAHGGTAYLRVNVDEFPIVKWDDTQIVYVNNDPECVTYIYSINRATKQVSGIRKPRANITSESCKDIQKNEIKLKLVSGFDVWQQQKSEHSNVFVNTLILILLGLGYLTGLYFVWRKKKPQSLNN